MKRTENYYDRYEIYDEINTICYDDDYNCFGRYAKYHFEESCYDTYTGSSEDDWASWN